MLAKIMRTLDDAVQGDFQALSQVAIVVFILGVAALAWKWGYRVS